MIYTNTLTHTNKIVVYDLTNEMKIILQQMNRDDAWYGGYNVKTSRGK